MNRIYFTFFIFIFFLSSKIIAFDAVGYVGYSTVNVGDDIQAVAVKKFLPENALRIEREFISEFQYPSNVDAVISGWYMHHKGGGYWDLNTPPPEKPWPPAPCIRPFFISMHLTGTFFPIVFSNENIEYLKKWGPIGARDFATLRELEKRGIPSYFSGCLTLTLENAFKERNNTIYLVDLDERCVKYIRSKTKSKIVEITHGRPILQLLNLEQRLKYAEQLLDKYRKAKCVITKRLHAAMPCLAFETPVLLISGSGPRFDGLIEHTWHCTEDELTKDKINYDFDNPPQNPKTYLPIRENLIKIMNEWVNNNTND